MVLEYSSRCIGAVLNIAELKKKSRSNLDVASCLIVVMRNSEPHFLI